MASLTLRAHLKHAAKYPETARARAGEELYIVISGDATFELDGKTHDALTETFVHVPGA